MVTTTTHRPILAVTAIAAILAVRQAAAEPVRISPAWATSMPAGPVSGTRITADYAKLVVSDAYFWAWPMVNMFNRRLAFSKIPQRIYSGAAPMAPINSLTMLTDYIEPDERLVACPNQDVVYGAGLLGLDQSPVVIQVPDFKDRFWVYQVVDLRTDSFAQLGKMYGTQPGFYLLVGPNWQGEVPKGITKVFRASTNTANVIPRVFQDDTPEDKAAIQEVLKGITLYPLSEFDGTMKSVDWSTVKKVPASGDGSAETQWVVPEKFIDELPLVLADAPPLPGEEARYAQVLAVAEAAKADPAIRKAVDEAAVEAEERLVKPLFQFRNYGLPLTHNWTTTSNNAAFGTDYYTRTAVAKSNIFVNAPSETKYFYQDLDQASARLNGKNSYTVTFAKGEAPAVNGFWSLTLYNEHHFFEPNDIKRYSLGTKNKSLKYNADGSLTIYVQSEPPKEDLRDNWLPAPEDGDFSLYIRAYWPKPTVVDGTWTPPAVDKAG
ncbi:MULTISPECIES: DUF1254 domain-containing protein [Ensifer]|jgi:hypothetical protein|nr:MULTISPECIES: DUF1254 domain-containing protein [Ensifer]MDP9634195.1 hypothetical protein [Ensifer adhaerens]KQU93593.1 hypothetical protein ASD00_23175 [Ensifer sp. Root31]KQW58584.1 hypothetical protein ASD02_06210 [Ensifer sp. Root1252]KQW74287.1 hypothetical protein ASD03_06845 [Ensifer sp. Root127]KQY78559.1 hypothetical protein ASD52_01510 [Ensifer sp. Root142]